jgi:hypothetical protein
MSPGQGWQRRANALRLYKSPPVPSRSPGQGWHRRANAQKCYKSPPNGQPITHRCQGPRAHFSAGESRAAKQRPRLCMAMHAQPPGMRTAPHPRSAPHRKQYRHLLSSRSGCAPNTNTNTKYTCDARSNPQQAASAVGANKSRSGPTTVLRLVPQKYYPQINQAR